MCKKTKLKNQIFVERISKYFDSVLEYATVYGEIHMIVLKH